MPGPPYGSISTGSFVPGWCQDGKSTAVRMPVGPAAKNRGAGCGRFGRCASEAMFPVTAPSREIRTVRSLVASVRLASTVVPPAAAAACTPGSVATGVSPAGPYRQTPTSVDSVDPVNSTSSPSVPITAWTCSPCGVTGVAAASSAAGAMIRPRVSPLIPVQTMSPPASWAGTPSTTSVHCGSVSSRTTAPVTALTIRIVFWSLVCTTSSRSSPQAALTR